MKRLATLALSALLVFLAFGARADEADLRKNLEGQLKIKVTKVSPTPVKGLFEVQVGDRIFYANDNGSYYFEGDLSETKGQKNLTAARRFTLLPLDLAVKTVRGNGANAIVTFEDPHCGYCKKLVKELANVKDVTIYTFLLPILSEDSAVKAKAIWCASDRSKAWNEWMASGITPPMPAKECDPMPMFRKVHELSQAFEISGTPFIMFANGNMARGYIAGPEIEKKLGRNGT